VRVGLWRRNDDDDDRGRNGCLWGFAGVRCTIGVGRTGGVWPGVALRRYDLILLDWTIRG
jgi:hypothetical protein